MSTQPTTAMTRVGNWGRHRPARDHGHKVELLLTWDTDPAGNTREADVQAALADNTIAWMIAEQDGHRWLTAYLPDPRPANVFEWLGTVIRTTVVPVPA